MSLTASRLLLALQAQRQNPLLQSDDLINRLIRAYAEKLIGETCHQPVNH